MIGDPGLRSNTDRNGIGSAAIQEASKSVAFIWKRKKKRNVIFSTIKLAENAIYKDCFAFFMYILKTMLTQGGILQQLLKIYSDKWKISTQQLEKRKWKLYI